MTKRFSSKQVDSVVNRSALNREAVIAAIADAATTTTPTPTQETVLASVPTLPVYRQSETFYSINSGNRFLALPNEMLLGIARFLMGKDIIQLMKVSRQLKELFTAELQNVDSRIFRRFCREYDYMNEMKASCDVEHRQAAVDIQKSNEILKSVIVPFSLAPASADRVTAHSVWAYNVICLVVCTLLLMLGMIDGLMLAVSNHDDRKKLLQANSYLLTPLLVLAIAAVACYFGAACNTFMRSCQPRYTLFTSGRESEKYDEEIKIMEEGIILHSTLPSTLPSTSPSTLPSTP